VDREPKCELLDGARSEAIDVPALRLRQSVHLRKKFFKAKRLLAHLEVVRLSASRPPN
jgi:hypothetical protein